LIDFERNLLQLHHFLSWNLRVFRAEGMELVFLSVVMILRPSNIILRRSYLDDILRA